MRTPVTRSSLRQHLNYNWWKYVCVLIAAIFGWNLIYTVTAYHPPQERVLSFHVATGSGNTDAINEYMQSKQEAFPSIEVFESSVVVEDEYYKAMQLTTKVAAR